MSQQSIINNQQTAISDQPIADSGQSKASQSHQPRLTPYSSSVGKYGLTVIILIFILLGLLYDVTVPFFEKPDELKHFAVIQFIQTEHRLPVVEAGVYKPWDQEGTQPPLYHILAAVTTAWLDLSDFEEPPRNPHYADDRSFVWRERGNNNLYLHPPGETWRLDPVLIAARLARWLSLLASVATLILTHRLARLIFIDDDSPQPHKSKNTRLTNPQPPISPSPAPQSPHLQSATLPPFHPSTLLPLLPPAFIAVIPQFLHVSSAITNDSLSVTLAAAALLLLALVIKKGSSTQYALLLGLILGLGAITKLSLLYLAPLTGLVFLLDLARHRSLPRFIGHGLLISGLMLLVCGWWFWRNWQVYGDITALNAHLLYRGGVLDPRPTLSHLWQTEMVGLELSFWAAFGAGQILIEPWLYKLLAWLKYLVFIGLIIGFRRLIRRSQFTIHNSQFTIILLLLLWTLLIFAALLRWMQITPASWGRLLYPTLPALSILVIWSLAQFPLPRKITIYDLRFTIYDLRLLPPLLLITCLFLLSLLSPFRYIQAAYAKTPLVAETQVPADINRLDFVYADALRLIGYRVKQPTVRPGEWLPVTLYWQATRPIAENYSAFVHLLGPDGQAIAQANTYPDGGKWPTSMLEPGRVLEDTYHIFIPSDAEAPVATRLALGIFEFDDPERAAKTAVDDDAQIVEPIVEGIPLLPRQWPTLNPEQPLDATFGGQIRLTGYDWINKNIRPRTQIPLTFYWETVSPPGQPLNLFIHLIDPASQTQVAGFDGPPAFPTTFWQRGTTIIDERLLTFPADLPPGTYELRIGWYDLETFARLEMEEGDSLLLRTLTVEP